jgi:hypothetical protein
VRQAASTPGCEGYPSALIRNLGPLGVRGSRVLACGFDELVRQSEFARLRRTNAFWVVDASMIPSCPIIRISGRENRSLDSPSQVRARLKSGRVAIVSCVRRKLYSPAPRSSGESQRAVSNSI